MKVVRGMKKCN